MTAGSGGDTPLVSVVMPVLNPHPVYFRESVESILRQTLERIEVIVVEDPSGRSAKAVIDGIGDARVRYFGNAQRTSLVRQRNRALAEARAGLVAQQDADDVAEPERIAKQFEFMRAHPAIGVVGAQLRVIDSDGTPLGYRRYPLDDASIVRAMRLFNPIPNPAVMFRRETVVAAGGYQYEAHAVEDYELWSRLAQRQVRFANHPEALLRYRVHRGANKSTRLHETIRGTLAVKRKYWRGSMDLAARARMVMEFLLLGLPAPLVLNLFLRTQLSSTLR